MISESEQSLLSGVIQKQLQVVLPDESVTGEPFYCLMEKGDSGQVTGTYIQNEDEEKRPFLILYFSKKEAEEMGTNLN